MRAVVTICLLTCLVAAVQAGDEENPFKKAKVGDWVEYKMTGPNMEGKSKMTIVAKNDKEVSYEVVSSFSINGKEVVAPVQKQTIDLTKSYDPLVAANLKVKGVKSEKLSEGKEKIKVGDKEFDTRWTQTKTTATVNNMTIVGEFKMWFAKDVPVSGLVKLDTTTSGFSMKLELIGSGRK